jgi:hypothetical protein
MALCLRRRDCILYEERAQGALATREITMFIYGEQKISPVRPDLTFVFVAGTAGRYLAWSDRGTQSLDRSRSLPLAAITEIFMGKHHSVSSRFPVGLALTVLFVIQAFAATPATLASNLCFSVCVHPSGCYLAPFPFLLGPYLLDREHDPASASVGLEA